MRTMLITMLLILVAACTGVRADPSVGEDLQAAIDRIDVDAIRSLQDHLEREERDKDWSLLALIYNFFGDYYSFIEEDDRRVRAYTDRAIDAATKAVDQNPSALAFSLLADGYSRRMTGPLTAIRFGGRLNEAIEKAEELDRDLEFLRYIQAKRYLLAPSSFGGDRHMAIEGFGELAKRNPHSSLYFAFLGESYGDDDPKQARAAFLRAVELSPNNLWARSRLP